MAANNDDGSGALFKNENRRTDKHPNARGTAEIKCPHCQEWTEFWVSAWTKEAGPQAKNPGMKFQSLAFQPKEDQPPKGPTSMEDKGYEDDIPF